MEVACIMIELIVAGQLLFHAIFHPGARPSARALAPFLISRIHDTAGIIRS